MSRKEELEEIIRTAGGELSQIKNAERALRDADYALQDAHGYGVAEEDLLGIIDLLYHPDHYKDLTDQD